MVKRHQQRQHVRVDHPGGEDPIRFELFSTERLEQHAVSLAQAQKISSRKKGQKLIPRVNDNSRVLLEAYKAVAKAVCEQHTITPRENLAHETNEWRTHIMVSLKIHFLGDYSSN